MALLVHFAHASGIESVGSASDSFTQGVVRQCLTNQTLRSEYDQLPGFGRGRCPALMDCVLSNLREVDKAGMAAAVSIVALVPTILALIGERATGGVVRDHRYSIAQSSLGAGPLELCRLGFISPIRATCTCLFGVGLPKDLFSSLQRYDDSNDGDALAVVRWRSPDRRGPIQLAFPLASPPRRRRTAVTRLALDTIIVGLAAIMLWRTWRINGIVIITWRCEYRLMLLFWPMACVGWMVLTLGSLLAMARNVRLVRAGGGGQGRWWAIFVAAYIVQVRRTDAVTRPTPGNTSVMLSSLDDGGNSHPLDDGANNSDGPILLMELSSELHWRWWSTAVQALAVGIYLYATIVMASMLFLTGSEAIVHAVFMTLCLTAIRIISSFL